MKSISSARLVAARVLQELESNTHAHAGDALAKAVRDEDLRPDDARLARAIIFGVLRHASTLDYYYAPYLKQSTAKLLPALRLCLRMAAYQHIMLTRIPAYAIVNETVDIARAVYRLKQPQVGFLNAVLRKLVAASSPPALPVGNRISDLSIRFGFPENYVRLLVDKYGTHRAIAVMEQAKLEPPLTLRVNTLSTTTEALTGALAAQGFNVEPAAFCPNALLVIGEGDHSLFDTPEFHAGHFYVQDEASQLVALLAAPLPDESILDLCAAPGGKTTHLAELSMGQANITATDLSLERLKLLHDNVMRLHTPGIKIISVSEVLESDSQYDLVLVDAPCSGAGTVRRNPEIAQRLTPETLQHHASRQLDALNSAAPLVKPGGRLVYSTCSISTEENENVIRSFIKQHPEFSIVAAAEDSATTGTTESESCPANGIFSAQQLRSADGFYRTWPTHPDIDGFVAVILTKQT